MAFRRRDGGFAWIITICSFFLHFYTIGMTYSFGVMFVRLKEVYQSSDSVVSWIGSIQGFMLYFTGLFGAPLIKHYSYRSIAICGATISSLGMLLSAFSPYIYLLYITYGLLTGIGFGLMYLTALVAVQHWFESRRATAAGKLGADVGNREQGNNRVS